MPAACQDGQGAARPNEFRNALGWWQLQRARKRRGITVGIKGAQKRSVAPAKIIRLTVLLSLLTLSIFACHISARLYDASTRIYTFGDGRPAFSELILYAAHLDWLRPNHFSYSGCINNLRQIDGAKEQWALDTKAPTNAIPTWNDIQPYLGRGISGTLPVCPFGGIYVLHDLQSAPTCSVKGHALQ
jgi:hypothetical protein